jgi:putative PIN family toxin of toxin-antitoxin system
LLDVASSWELAEEIVEVLRRPHLKRYGITEEDVQEILALLSPFLPTVETEIRLRDPKDAPVVHVAVAAHAQAIVTGDKPLLEDREVLEWLSDRGVEVLTPAEALERLAGG